MMKDFDCYKTNLPYPNRDEFTTVYAYKRGKVVAEMSAKKWAAMKEKPEHTTTERDRDDAGYKAAMAEYRADERRLIEEFKQDLYREFDVLRCVKRDRAFDLAWEYGHSSGFSEIYNHFADLSDLLS